MSNFDVSAAYLFVLSSGSLAKHIKQCLVP